MTGDGSGCVRDARSAGSCLRCTAACTSAANHFVVADEIVFAATAP
jgi:hypothetical protein